MSYITSSSFFLFSFLYLIVTTMGEGDLNLDCFCGKLWEVPMSPQISITLGEEKKFFITLNGHYINLWKFWHFLIYIYIYIYIFFFSCNQIATLFSQLRIFDPFLPIISFIFKWFLIMHLNPFNFVLLNFYHVCHSHISILAQSLYSYFLKCNVYFSKKGEKSIKLF